MHPILGHFRRLVVYLVAWGPISALLSYLFVSLGGMRWALAIALSIPLCLYYAFVCLSAWYSCRSIRLEKSTAWMTHLVAAACAGILWVVIARGLAIAFSSTRFFTGVQAQVARQVPLLFAGGMLLYLLSTALFYILLSSQTAHEAEKNAVEARALARDSELKALKTQVNPHFIFNCLNSISALTSSDPTKAREMCVLLGEFLRKTLGLGEKALIPLKDELSLLRAYLAVEQIRFSSRLKVEESAAPDALDSLLPPLLLQPLVENAVRHGVAQLTEDGWIRIEIRQPEPENLAISIENNFDADAPHRKGAGIGLKNVRQRLDASYGNRAKLDVRTNHNQFVVSLSLPVEKGA